ncbi:MAG: aminotransferase class IV [Frankiales bacterium]|nr:aminotransferase class IV [Frankiales bacterium]
MAEVLQLLDGEPWSRSGWVDPLSLLGCYTSFAVDAAGAVVDFAAHLDRLHRDSALLLGVAPDLQGVRRLAAAHLAQVGGGPVRMRIAVLAQTPPVQPQEVMALHVATTTRPLVLAPETPWRVRTVEHLRTLPQVKAVDPFAQLHLKREARLAGFDDALLARGEELLEGTSWASIAVLAGAVVLPGPDALASIGGERVAKAAGLPIERRPLRRHELDDVRLLLASTAITPVTAIEQVDGRAVRVDAELIAALRRACADQPAERV